jgi:hypothetical protein
MPVVRLSRGSFDPANFMEVRRRLEDADQVLVPAIQRMRGCLHHWAGVDPISNTMINVSVWASLEDAKHMETLAPMRALAEEFVRLGVMFERPIANYETVWSV